MNIPTKKVYCFNCGKECKVTLQTREDDYECIDCIGNDIVWSQTE